MMRRNKFSLSHYKLLTGKMGFLYPVACVETLPGDTFQMATSVFLRFTPMVAPAMTPVIVKLHHWFVPYRLLWDEFEDFITGGPQGTSVPTPPYIQISGASSDQYIKGKLLDYLGVPPSTDTSPNVALRFSSLFARAYSLIWNEWYRDQNIQDELLVPKYSGQETTSNGGLTNFNLLRSAWDKDYFTTASPWEQKGLAVNVPVNSASGEVGIDTSITFSGSIPGGGASLSGTGNRIVAKDGSSQEVGAITATAVSGGELNTSIGNINLNQFREAMALQRFEEHRALYGSRYVEYLRYLGVKASDGRLQRPEYLGGGRSVIQFSEVLQTAQDGDTPVGTMRGHGIGAMRTNRFRRFFEEHGVVMTLLSIRPKAIYTQGLPRKFSRFIKTDYWQKELEHIGQQEVLNREIYAWQDNPNGTFGYQDRYNEYRSEVSSVHGQFRDILSYWHLGREFASAPVLNSDFISSLPSDRIFADQTGNDTILMMVNNSIQARRMISKRGNPR